ncbi:MAG TPA: aldehyde dehydrogenase (NADP(+)) [Sphingomonas sp.]|nr:aldehyde dehydrogenase (NADP(+)) [Sphingomonas sp.]
MLDGASLIGGEAVRGGDLFRAVDPSSGELIAPEFAGVGATEVARACELAAAAFDTYRETDPEIRARFLEAIADNIEALGDTLIQRAMAESGLPRARLEGERGRTCGQLRLFATLVRSGDWLGVRVDSALPERKPLPRPDIRLRKIAVGPVAVFGASNFPLAFSVAGGDTASALAAGCPVVVKGHPAHPGTGELVGRAIRDAVKACELPDGVFALLQGASNALGGALVADPRIKAVGFTGSRGGGMALVQIAATRPEPIPVYAEMSSVNPVILFPAALAARAEALAESFVQSLTSGAGQFCTNPGILIGIEGRELDRFVVRATDLLGQVTPHAMLTPGIHRNFEQGVAAFAEHHGVDVLARGAEGAGPHCARGVLFATDAATFLADPNLSHEVFGSSSILVRCKDLGEVAALIEGLEGQLTATLQLDDADVELARPLLPILERRAGRVLANGWPTGVEVCHAMVHGGPFPATSDSRTTSVGTLAIERFLRPISYQNLPDALLPLAVKAANPLGVQRLVDGRTELAPR